MSNVRQDVGADGCVDAIACWVLDEADAELVGGAFETEGDEGGGVLFGGHGIGGF